MFPAGVQVYNDDDDDDDDDDDYDYDYDDDDDDQEEDDTYKSSKLRMIDNHVFCSRLFSTSFNFHPQNRRFKPRPNRGRLVGLAQGAMAYR